MLSHLKKLCQQQCKKETKNIVLTKKKIVIIKIIGQVNGRMRVHCSLLLIIILPGGIIESWYTF